MLLCYARHNHSFIIKCLYSQVELIIIIRLWGLDNGLCVQEYRGHVVRDVKVVNADVFLSASNDW